MTVKCYNHPLLEGEGLTAAGKGMAVFRYEATKKLPEDYRELGTVVARDKDEAKAKLKQDGFSEVPLKRIRGLAALWNTFTADIR